MQQLGWIGPNETLEGLETAGDGNMNRTLRARLRQRTLVLKQSVPYRREISRSFAAPADRIAVEAAFYRATAQPPGTRACECRAVLGFDPDNRLLALEDLGASGGLHRHLYYDQATTPTRRARISLRDIRPHCSIGSACCTDNVLMRSAAR